MTFPYWCPPSRLCLKMSDSNIWRMSEANEWKSHILLERVNISDMSQSSISYHYSDVIIGPMASQITSLTIVYSTVCSGADQRKYQSSASLAFVRGIHRWLVNSPHKGPVTRKMLPFDDVIMSILNVTLTEMNNSNTDTHVETCIEQLGCHTGYFVL